MMQGLNGCNPGIQPVKSTRGSLAIFTDVVMFLENVGTKNKKNWYLRKKKPPGSAFHFSRELAQLTVK